MTNKRIMTQLQDKSEHSTDRRNNLNEQGNCYNTEATGKSDSDEPDTKRRGRSRVRKRGRKHKNQ